MPHESGIITSATSSEEYCRN